MDAYTKSVIHKDLVKEGTDEFIKEIKYKDQIVKSMWEKNTRKILINSDDYIIEISLYTGDDKHEFLRSGERVFREICFKHTVDGCDYWVPLDRALKYHPLNVRSKGRNSKTNLNTLDDYFIIKKK